MTRSPTSTPQPPAADAAQAREAANTTATSLLREEFEHELGVDYGAHSRQVFDCYFPDHVSDAPVMIFLHGGGFRLGSPGPVAHYGRPILEAGGIFVSLGYRLAPDVRFPDTIEDAELGLAAIQQLVQSKGAADDVLYLSGHSAGASLAAAAALRPKTAATQAVDGLVLVSGMYNDSARTPETANLDSPRFVPDLTMALERIPTKTIVVAGDNDLPAVLPAATAITTALEGRGGSVQFFVEENADHFQAIRGFATSGSPVATAVLEMMGLA